MAGPDLTMPLDEAMRTQRAIRRLKTDPVDDALVLQVIELALKAPTGSNAQNWEFIVVKDPAVKAKLARINRRAGKLYLGLGRRMAARQGDTTMLRIIDAVQWQTDHFEEIPVVVVACLQRVHPALAADRDLEPLRLDLSVGAESIVGGARRRSRRRPAHAAAGEPVLRPPRARVAVERDAVCGRSARLAARPLRSDDPPAGRRGGLARPLRQPRVPHAALTSRVADQGRAGTSLAAIKVKRGRAKRMSSSRSTMRSASVSRGDA